MSATGQEVALPTAVPGRSDSDCSDSAYCSGLLQRLIAVAATDCSELLPLLRPARSRGLPFCCGLLQRLIAATLCSGLLQRLIAAPDCSGLLQRLIAAAYCSA